MVWNTRAELAFVKLVGAELADRLVHAVLGVQHDLGDGGGALCAAFFCC